MQLQSNSLNNSRNKSVRSHSNMSGSRMESSMDNSDNGEE